MRREINAAGCVGIIVLWLAMVVAMSLLMALPVWLLWNDLMPDLFHLPAITFWQALGLSMLARCLFGTGATTSSSSSSK